MSIDVEVIIVGGGGCGLSLSSFLSDYGISHVLFERHSGTSRLPKAHLLNQRTMEIFRQHGMAGAVLEQAATIRNFGRVKWVTSLGGGEEFDRKDYGSVNCFGGGGFGLENPYVRDCPIGSANLPQLRLEPILRRIAEKRNSQGVMFNHKVTHATQSNDSVTAHVTDGAGSAFTLRSKYLVGADGGKTIGNIVGIEMDGIPAGFARIITAHFKADLYEYWNEQDFLVNIINSNGDAGLLPIGPTWGRKSEEWIMHLTYPTSSATENPPLLDKESVVQTIRTVLKIPDLQVDVLQVSPWEPECVLASEYRKGHIFVAGDAAHRHPPTGGLGLNTGIADAHNLAWKLALVLKGLAGKSLLDTYEVERRPAGKRNCDWAMMAMMNRAVLNVAIGINRGDELRNMWRLAHLFEDSEGGVATRALLQQHISTQRVEFSAHGLDIGFSYEQGALISDGSMPPPTDPAGQTYYPSTRPGQRLPHVWIQNTNYSNSDLISTHDLIGVAPQFLLITDEDGLAWITQLGVDKAGAKLKVVTISSLPTRKVGAQYIPVNKDWEAISGLQSGGAILVRPDNMIGWRSVYPPRRNGTNVVQALGKILGMKLSNLESKM